MSPTATSNKSLAAQFLAARRVSVPLVVVRTNDPAATIATLSAALDGGKTPCPVLRWDNINGLQAGNAPAGSGALAAILAGPPKIGAEMLIPDVEAFVALKRAPAHTCVFFQNAHLHWKEKQNIQAIWNLRDQFKTNYRTLVLLTPPGAAIPAEIQADVVVLDEPLPTKAQLTEVVESIYTSVNVKPVASAVEKSVDALAGVRSAFLAEQVTAMCMTKNGVDLDAMWAQKKQLINDTPGLTYIEPSTTFEKLGGADALKVFFKRVFNGGAPPSVIVFIDEIDDMFAGVGGDTSGISTALHGKFLTQMTSSDAKGVILMGHPGVGKSAIVQAAGREFGVPIIGLDFGDMKNSLVGASEERAAQALAVIDAISFGRALYVGTCNAVDNLSPQLQRRFPWRFFFDLPTTEEKKMIWPIYEQRPHAEAAGPLSKAQLADRPDDRNWTGAEIRECCENAWRFGCTLREGANYVVPIAVSMPEAIEERRTRATNRYLSASYPGVYKGDVAAVQAPKLPSVRVPLPVAIPRAIADMPES